MTKKASITSLCLLVLPAAAGAAAESLPTPKTLDITHDVIGYLAISVTVLAYVTAMSEDVIALRKSKPMVLGAALVWFGICIYYAMHGQAKLAVTAFESNLLAYVELLLFILVSMTYLNALEDRGIFDTLRIWLLSKGFGYRTLFCITGIQTFFLSSVCNNLTTALLMGTVVLAMARDNRPFITVAYVNIVVATNAGGSFSPFGDITTLLVWQKGVVPFVDFFSLFVPSVVNFALPAVITHFWIPRDKPASAGKAMPLRRGASGIIVLFLLTIVTAICFEHFLELPPAAGMLAGLSYLKFYFYYLYKTRDRRPRRTVSEDPDSDDEHALEMPRDLAETKQFFDVFHNVAQLEWDTLLFFLRRHGQRRGPEFHRLRQARLTGALHRPRPHHRKRAGWQHLCCHRQRHHHVRSADHGAHPLPGTMAAGHVDGRRRRKSAGDRFSGRRGAPGPGEGCLHLRLASQVDSGDCCWLCGKHRRSFPDQRASVLKVNCVRQPIDAIV